jgi:hypothetical protein
MRSDTLKRRFAELATELKAVEASRQKQRSLRELPEIERVDNALLLKWSVKVAQMFEALGTAGAQYEKRFINPPRNVTASNIGHLQHLAAIFLAAKEDFDGGHLNSLRNLVSADLFDSQLDQARQLMKSGYAVAAAVIAGIVLETTMQRLCDDKGISRTKLNRMNDDLAGAEVYTKLEQKKITTWAAIRNSAAHGDTTQFRSEDVPMMIEGIEGFVSVQLT